MDDDEVASCISFCFQYFCREQQHGSSGLKIKAHPDATMNGAKFQRFAKHCGLLSCVSQEDIELVLKQMGSSRFGEDSFVAVLNMLAVTAFPRESTTAASMRKLALQTIVPAAKALRDTSHAVSTPSRLNDEAGEVLSKFRKGLEKVFEYCFADDIARAIANPDKITGLSRTNFVRFLEDFGLIPSPLSRSAANGVYQNMIGAAAASRDVGGRQWLFDCFLESLVSCADAAFSSCALGPGEMVAALLEVMHYSKGAEKLAGAKGWAGQTRKLILSERALLNQQQLSQIQLQHQNQTGKMHPRVSADGWMYGAAVPSASSNSVASVNARTQFEETNLSSNNNKLEDGNNSSFSAVGRVLDSLSSYHGVSSAVKAASARVNIVAAEEDQITGRPAINKASEKLTRNVPMLFNWKTEKERKIAEQRKIQRADELKQCRKGPELSTVTQKIASRRGRGKITDRLLAEGELLELRRQQRRQEEEIFTLANANPSITEKSACMVRPGEVSERLHKDALQRGMTAEIRQFVAQEEFSVDSKTGVPLFQPSINPTSERFAAMQRDRRTDPIEVWLHRWGEEKQKRVADRAEQEAEEMMRRSNAPKVSERSAQIVKEKERSRSTPRRRRFSDMNRLEAPSFSGECTKSCHSPYTFEFRPFISQRSRELDESLTVATGMRDRVQRLLTYKKRYMQQRQEAAELKEQLEMQKCPFAPKPSKQPAWAAPLLGTVADRERIREIEKKQRLEDERRRKEEEEMAACTFRPASSVSLKRAQRKSLDSKNNDENSNKSNINSSNVNNANKGNVSVNSQSAKRSYSDIARKKNPKSIEDSRTDRTNDATPIENASPPLLRYNRGSVEYVDEFNYRPKSAPPRQRAWVSPSSGGVSEYSAYSRPIRPDSELFEVLGVGSPSKFQSADPSRKLNLVSRTPRSSGGEGTMTKSNRGKGSSERPSWNAHTRSEGKVAWDHQELRQQLFENCIDRRNLRVREGPSEFADYSGDELDLSAITPKYTHLHPSPPRFRFDSSQGQETELKDDVMSWTVSDVRRWVCDQGLPAHASRFVEQGINGHSLLHLTQSELENNLNITHFGARKKILTGIARLKGMLTDSSNVNSQSAKPLPREEPEREKRLRQYVQNAMRRAALQ